LPFASIQEGIEGWIFVGSVRLCIVAGCFAWGFLIDSFGEYFLEFSFAFEADIGNSVGVDSTEEVAIAAFAMVEEFHMDGQYSIDTFLKYCYLLVDINFLCKWAIIAVFEGTDHLNFL
jgi:hypothetical protein